MDLIRSYLKDKGVTGAIKELSVKKGIVCLCYQEEGCEAVYRDYTIEEATGILNHWGDTGEIIVKEFNRKTLMRREVKRYPLQVMVMTCTKFYERVPL